jgi:putative endonuclease
MSTVAAKPRRWTVSNHPRHRRGAAALVNRQPQLAFSTCARRSRNDSQRQQPVHRLPCSAAMHVRKRVVYILKSCTSPARYYSGLTSDVRARLVAHNTAHCAHTINGCPWDLDVMIKFRARRAVAFERYLKSGSGVASLRLVTPPSTARHSVRVGRPWQSGRMLGRPRWLCRSDG